MARNVIVQCVCDICGKTAYVRAPYNEDHDLYEESLPADWEFIDNFEYKWISHIGDHCPDCLISFERYINMCCARWMKYIKLGGRHAPDTPRNDVI